jgi:hypothetical protein
VTGVEPPTGTVATVNVLLVVPAATVTVAGTVETAVLLLVRDTTAPPAGAADVSVTVPVEPVPPATVDGFTETAAKEAVAGALCGVKRRVEENGPNTPAEFRARTRHHNCCAGSPLSVTRDVVTVGFAEKGAAMVDDVST